jgi:sulfopyruvate decarboxylase TPP-binding subunit
MSKRHLNFVTDIIPDMIELSEEEHNFSEISSEREEEIVSLGSVAGTSMTTSTDT